MNEKNRKNELDDQELDQVSGGMMDFGMPDGNGFTGPGLNSVLPNGGNFTGPRLNSVQSQQPPDAWVNKTKGEKA